MKRRRKPQPSYVLEVRLDFGPFVEAMQAFRDALLRVVNGLPSHERLVRYAIEHMDIAESDIKRIDLVPVPVVVLKNWRSVPIDLAAVSAS